MADAKEEKHGELCHVNISVVENGYKVSTYHDSSDQSLGARAGWYPSSPGESKEYVEKTKDAVLKRLKEVL